MPSLHRPFGAVTAVVFAARASSPELITSGRDEHAAVEAAIMLITNWAASWFEYWPAPPLHVLAVAERLAFLQDPPLVKHLVSLGAGTNDYLWPMLQSMFCDVMDYKVTSRHTSRPHHVTL